MMKCNYWIKSFVRRERSMSEEQSMRFAELWKIYGLEISNGLLNCSEIYGRNAPLILEIGFGHGESLLGDAVDHPEKNYLGIEVYQPGVVVTVNELVKLNLKNIRIYKDDALLVLPNCLPDKSLDEVRLFFPDPWPKRAHQKRRLVRFEFIELLALKLKPNGYFHFVTDWQDYYEYVLKIFTKEKKFHRVENHNFALPCQNTKFAKRGLKSGRNVYVLNFQLFCDIMKK